MYLYLPFINLTFYHQIFILNLNIPQENKVIQVEIK